MTKLSLKEASLKTGKDKTTLFRAIKNGKLSAEKNQDGHYKIDVSELFRAYPPLQDVIHAMGEDEMQCNKTQLHLASDATPRNAEQSLKMVRLEAENEYLLKTIQRLETQLTETKIDKDKIFEMMMKSQEQIKLLTHEMTHKQQERKKFLGLF